MESIVYQSISGKAAATIFARIKALGTDGRPPSPEQMLKIAAAKLRKAGLSGAKVLAMKDLAKKALSGVVPMHEEALKLSDEELVRTARIRPRHRGLDGGNVFDFPPWPSRCAAHPRSWSKKGWSVAYGKKHMPKPKELLEFGERWRPYRTVASWYMWRAFERAGYKVTNKIRPRPLRKKNNRKAGGKKERGKGR